MMRWDSFGKRNDLYLNNNKELYESFNELKQFPVAQSNPYYSIKHCAVYTKSAKKEHKIVMMESSCQLERISFI